MWLNNKARIIGLAFPYLPSLAPRGGTFSEYPMFFFSNRMGCLTSLLISIGGTLVLLLIMGVIRL